MSACVYYICTILYVIKSVLVFVFFLFVFFFFFFFFFFDFAK